MPKSDLEKWNMAVYGAEYLTSVDTQGHKEYDDFCIKKDITQNLTYHSLDEWDIVVIPYTIYLGMVTNIYHKDYPDLIEQPIEVVHLEQKIRSALRQGRTVCFLLESHIKVPFPSSMFVDIEWIYNCFHAKSGERDLKDYVIGHRVLRSMNISPAFTQALTSGYQTEHGEFDKYLQNYASGKVYFNCDERKESVDVICRDDNNHIAGFCVAQEKGRLFLMPYMRHSARDLDEAMEDLASGIITYLTKTTQEEPSWAGTYIFRDEAPLSEKRDKLNKALVDLDKKLSIFIPLREVLWQRDYDLQKSVPKFLQHIGLETREDEIYEEDFWITQDGQDTVIVEVKSGNGNLRRQDIGKLDDHRIAREKKDDFPALLIANTFALRHGIKEKDVRIEPNVCARATQDKVLVMRTLDLVRLRDLILQDKLTSQEFIELICRDSGWLEVDVEGYKIHKG